MVVKPNVGHSILDMTDNMIKSYLRITDEELDFICEYAADDELMMLTKIKTSFSDRRGIINILNKYINYG